jgi:hypothetical protein
VILKFTSGKKVVKMSDEWNGLSRESLGSFDFNVWDMQIHIIPMLLSKPNPTLSTL